MAELKRPPLIITPRTTFARKLCPDTDSYRRLLFVINPVAGHMAIKPYLAETLRAFTLNGWLPTVYETNAKGDATAFIKAHGAEYDAIVCSGGDGTLNEAVTALYESGLSLPLGYLPAGSTNVFADSHGLSKNPVTAAETFLTGKDAALDLGLFNDSVFSYVAAFGAFSGLSYTTPQDLKNVLGPGAYVLDALKDLPNIRREHVRVTGTGCFLNHRGDSAAFSNRLSALNAEGDFLFGAVNNCASVASLFYLPSELVSYDDGLFEVMLIRFPDTQFDLQKTVAALREQDYLSTPDILLFRASEIRFETEDGLLWALDGERANDGGLAEIRVLPKALRIVLPDE